MKFDQKSSLLQPTEECLSFNNLANRDQSMVLDQIPQGPSFEINVLEKPRELELGETSTKTRSKSQI